MKLEILSDLANRALKFNSNKTIEDMGSRTLLEIKHNKCYLTTCNGSDGLIEWFDCLDKPLECCVHTEAFATILTGFKKDDEIKLEVKNGKLVIKGKITAKLSIYNTNDIYNIPIPKDSDWEAADKKLSDVLNRVLALPVRDDSKMFQKTIPSIIIDEENICYISKTTSVVEKNPSKFSAHIFATSLLKKPDSIKKYFSNGNQLYLYGDNEICMLTLNAAKPVAYHVILKEVQKFNTSVININVDILRDLVKRIKVMKKVEGIFEASEISAVYMEVTDENLTIKTSVFEESIPIESDHSQNSLIKFKVILSFLTAITHEAFVRDSETVALHIGPNMHIAYATNETMQIMGALWVC